MTLSTNVAVRLPEDHTLSPRIVLEKLCDFLIIGAGPWEPNLGGFFDENYGPPTKRLPDIEESGNGLHTRMGQGFHAITSIEFKDGGPLYTTDQTNRDLYPEDYDDEDGEDSKYADRLARPACTYLMDMDTAYGAKYSVAKGAAIGVTGCTTLHAYAISRLHEWLAERGGSVVWENEYAGTWHDMDDREGWAKFVGNGEDAMSWYRGSVLPAIARHTR